MASRQEAFARLVEDYSRVVASAIRRVCSRRHRSLIPDIQQEVYAALWKRLESGKEIEHPASYLYKVALTTALAQVRKHLPETPLEGTEEVVQTSGGGFAGLLPEERRRLLAEVLERLSPEQSRAIRAYLAGFNHAEVASLFGWSESVARHRIYRGIEELKEKVKGPLHGSAAIRPA